jgi:prolyl-tRNA synthetase
MLHSGHGDASQVAGPPLYHPPMRMSRLFGRTLRKPPAGSDAAGHQLLLRSAALRPLAAGVFSTLPVGLRVQRRVEAILRDEMVAAGGVEVSLPVVHPAELWAASGRLGSVGPELARFEDRRGRGLVLAMTHEEVVAALAASEIESWRDLPRLVFQIQTKFRDDPRPRAGLIRAREFVMKDAYSLDRDEEGLDGQYQRLHLAYERVFERCRLPVRSVGADVGMMGGSAAHEFMYLTPIGEDTVVICDACGSAQNRQVAVFSVPDPAAEAPRPAERVATPGASSIADLTGLLGIGPERAAKVVFFAAGPEPAAPAAAGPEPARPVAAGSEPAGPVTAAETPVVAVVRGDMTVNETKLARVLGAGGLRPLTDEEIRAVGCEPGYASPLGVAGRVTVVVDTVAARTPNLVAGANEPGAHLRDVNVARDFTPDVVADIAVAEDGHGCARCGAPLRTERAVEVGNIFKLGTRYAEALGATYLDAAGTPRPVFMGSYGIGVGRLLACIVEEHHDGDGVVWPGSVAPFAVHVCALGEDHLAAGGALHDELEAAGVAVLLDDRGFRPGVQFADADLVGAPLRVTVSARAAAAGGVEVTWRDRRQPARVVPAVEVAGMAGSA